MNYLQKKKRIDILRKKIADFLQYLLILVRIDFKAITPIRQLLIFLKNKKALKTILNGQNF